MRLSRVALITLAVVLFSGFTARSASAASFQLCLALDGPVSVNTYYLNFNAQGNAILVAGMKGVGYPDDHGPVFGSLARTVVGSTYQLGLTVTFVNGGDYMGQNTENVVFQFNANGSITYKRWLNSAKPFTQGVAVVIACPN
jgi:hypothetical protein